MARMTQRSPIQGIAATRSVSPPKNSSTECFSFGAATVAASENGERPGRVEPNRVAVALACRAAMREHRKGKPIAFQLRTRP